MTEEFDPVAAGLADPARQIEIVTIEPQGNGETTCYLCGVALNDDLPFRFVLADGDKLCRFEDARYYRGALQLKKMTVLSGESLGEGWTRTV